MGSFSTLRVCAWRIFAGVSRRVAASVATVTFTMCFTRVSCACTFPSRRHVGGATRKTVLRSFLTRAASLSSNLNPAAWLFRLGFENPQQRATAWIDPVARNKRFNYERSHRVLQTQDGHRPRVGDESNREQPHTRTRNTPTRAHIIRTGRAGHCLTLNERAVLEGGVFHGTTAGGGGIRELHLPGQRGRPTNSTPSHSSAAPEIAHCGSTCRRGKSSGATKMREF